VLREGYDPMHRFAHIPTPGMEPDAGLRHLDTLRDDDVTKRPHHSLAYQTPAAVYRAR
jgi:hypothetical protein